MRRLGLSALGLILAFEFSPAMLLAQKKEDFIALQRDVAALQEQVKGLQKSQDDKFAALQGLLQQAVDASGRVTAGMTTLQHEVDTKLNDQQGKLVAPVATLGSKIDQLADDSRAVGNSVTDLVQRVNALDTKLADISSAIRSLQTQAPAPPAPAPATQIPAAPVCPTTADSLWENARRDSSTGHPDMALTEYVEYAKCYHDTANAPTALYKVGTMYLDNGQYDEAVKAFDSVLEQFPENPSRPEAMYFKGIAQMKAGHNTDAGQTFKDYLNAYPRKEHVAMAHQNLRTLGFEHQKKR
jgi:TolA-binding protein